MIPVNQTTYDALHQAVKQVRAQISWLDDQEVAHTITSDDRIISLKKEAEGYYCKSTLRKLTIQLAGTDTNILDQRITATVQVKTGADTWGDISWGSFTVTEATIDEEKGTSTFVAYGGIAQMQALEYTPGDLTFPTTVAGLAQQIARRFGITIETATMALPTEYQAVEYLEATGTQYLRIYTVTDGDKLTIDLDSQFTEGTETSQAIVASSGSTGSWFGQHGSLWSGNISAIPRIPATTRLNARVKFSDTEAQRMVAINNDTGEKFLDQAASPIVAAPLGLFATGTGGCKCKAKIYSAVLYLNGTEIRRLIPCYRRSDNKPGLYDTIGGEFYTNVGTGEFTVGADLTNLPNYDAPIPEDLWAKITGTTYRDILEEIAGATGTIAVIGRGNDQLDFDLPPINAATETLTENNLITAKIGENWGKVSAVVLSRQPQGDNVEVVDTATAASPGGRNLMKLGTAKAANHGITSVVNPDGSVTVTGTMQGTWADLTIGAPISLKNGETYTCSINKDGEGTLPVAVNFRTNSPRFDFSVAARTASKTRTINDGQDKTTCYLYISGANGAVCDFTIRPMIEKGATAHPYEPFTPNGRVDLVIANNEILDKQRETTAQPILDATKGWAYRNAEIKTEGHGYHEIGDRVDISVAGETYPAVVTKSTIQVDGGIKETLISATPEIVPIDYAKAGGITKTVFRTELAVDKQEQRIDAIVSRQDSTDAQVAEQFTQLTQDLEGFVAVVQQSGGGNLIRNSVGYGKDSSGILTIWQYGTGADENTVRSQSSPASLNAGAVSGYEIMLTGATEISQPIALTPGETYTLSVRAQKAVTGSATITLGSGTNSVVLDFPDQTASAWQKKSVEFTPAEGANTITLASTAGTVIEITDLMLATGGKTSWRQASGEIYNTQVSLDQGGVRVSSSVHDGDYVEITPLEFAGYSNASGSVQKVFSLNRDTTVVEKLEARSQMKMPPIKIVPINNTSYQGWAIVKEEN